MASSVENNLGGSCSAPFVHSMSDFVLDRVLYEDPRAKTANLLGTCTTNDVLERALLLLEKTHYTPTFLSSLRLSTTFPRRETIGRNDIYTWMFGWDRDGHDAPTKMTLICPATDDLIAKYSAPHRRMMIETPHMYQLVTRPWIESLPASKTTWVQNILQGISETESVLYSDPDPKTGFVILPDMKWDRRTLSSLYLMAIVRDGSLVTLRDLTKQHVPLLRKIQQAGQKVAHEVYGLSESTDSTSPLRCFVHYMPTYFHLHVHMLSANFVSHPGSLVGQAHLLDDVIDLLELGVDFRQRTLSYALAEGHALLRRWQEEGYA